MKNKTIRPLGLYLCFLGLAWVLFIFLRVAFWIFISDDLPELFGHETFKAFWIGVRFDARAAALFTLPFGVILTVPWLARRLHKAWCWSWVIYTLFFLIVIGIYSGDFGFYAYLKQRISTLVFELLEDFKVAVEMVWESYPVIWITLGVLVVTILCGWLFGRLAKIRVEPSASMKKRVAGFIVGFIIFALAIYGRVSSSLFPLRWSNAYFSTSEAVIALGLNPVLNLFDTYNSLRAGTYDIEKVKQAYPAMVEYLKIDKPDGQSLNFTRTVKAARDNRLNVVIVIMESLCYPMSSFAPGNLDPTPYAKKLASESLLFHNFYANTRTTARAIFTTMTGLPDLSEGATSSRNPMVVDQRILANEFEGYDKYYMLGGSTNWANIRAVLASNVKELEIMDEGSWQSPIVDVWGITDYDLFREAADFLDDHEGNRPFLAVIQSASFHKPFTIPDFIPNFKVESLSEEDRRSYGFVDAEEYNSLRLSDYALNEFMRLAKSSDFYDNTVFLIFGDHGLNINNHNMPGGYTASNLAPWHVPLIIHASPALNLFEPGETYMPASQIDIFPTAAGLAGSGYNNYTLGRDLFDESLNDSRFVYIGGKVDTPVRVVSDDFCLFVNKVSKEKFLFKLTDAEKKDYSEEYPDTLNKMLKFSEEFEETAKYLLQNNKKPPAGRMAANK